MRTAVHFARFMRSEMCSDSLFLFFSIFVFVLFFFVFFWGGGCFFGLRLQKSMDHFLDCGQRNYFAS